MKFTQKSITICLVTASAILISSGAQADAIISNGTVQIGVRDLGDLNVPGGALSGPSGTDIVGLRDVATGSDSTSPGCTCEGWGAGIKDFTVPGNNVSGFANSAVGNGNVSLVNFSFDSTNTSAVSIVNVLGATGGAILQVKHDYHPIAVTPYLYAVDVSITNLSGTNLAPGQLVYRRVMDWDVPFPSSEHVDLQGVPALLGIANGNNVRRTDNNGFNSGDPFSFNPFGLTDVNFTNATGDIGALFDFEFDALANGATRTFTTYYGAAPDKATADIARSLVNAGLYSYGYPSIGTFPPGSAAIDTTLGTPVTFIFGFGGAGGVLDPVVPGVPSAVPEPATLSILCLGLVSLGWSRRRKVS
ncbi:MAG: PEP-CTERM sorting domain-containing protein [Pseudomonadota bacterium]